MFEFEIGNNVGQFECIRKVDVEECGGTLYEFTHPSGAKLLYLASSDCNKHFSVTFKTIPFDSTGVFHILEHSVLCGSKKHNVKEPFVELIKSSMNTFLNALTFSDKTMYPVSSRNERDFLNLTGVYLDAVFSPNIYSNSSIFRQEGWHFEKNDKGEYFFNGVVYNEMKGDLSSVDSAINEEFKSLIFPSGCYHHDSGGNPEEIPSLTYEKFLETHKKFYNPSNAYFYVEGDIDLSKPVKLIEEYISGYTKTDVSYTDIEYTPAVSPSYNEMEFAVNGDTKEKAHIIFGKILSTYEDRLKLACAGILNDYLLSSLESPLIKRILEKKLAQDVRMVVENGIQQPYYYFEIVNTEKDRLEKIKEEIKDVIDGILKEGIDKEEISAIISQGEFTTHEVAEPRALRHNIYALGSYLYGGSPELYLSNKALYTQIRALLDKGYFEALLKELFDFDSLVTLVALPSETYGLKAESEERGRVKEMISKMSIDEVAYFDSEFDKMKLWQTTPDSEEGVASIPKLSLSDVSEKPEDFPTDESEVNNVKVLLHPSDISEIAYITLFFPLPKEFENKITDAAFMLSLLKDFPTKKHDVLSLNRELKKNTGASSFSLVVSAKKGENDSCRVYAAASFSSLKSRIKEASDLIREIILETDFSNIELLKSIILQDSEDFRNSIIEEGHNYGRKRACSHLSSRDAVTEKMDGITAYLYAKKLEAMNDDELKSLTAELEKIKDKIFTTDKMILSLAYDRTISENIADEYKLSDCLLGYPSGESKDINLCVKVEENRDEVIEIPSGVSYVCSSASLNRAGDRFGGDWNVASNIVTYEYLWNAVRVQGGAYGVGMRVASNDVLFYYSYRDPSGENTYEAYEKTPEFLEKFSDKVDNLDKYIISTIASKEPLLSPKVKVGLSDLIWLDGTTYEDRCKTRREILNTKPEDLKRIAETLYKLNEKMYRCNVSGLPTKGKSSKIVVE